MTAFKKGDAVRWSSSQGKVRGKVVKTVTSPTRIKGHKVAASKDNPEVIVESDKTGAQAAHKPGALKKG
jgi:Hypervirulence associated proteins TUDOR domain